MTICEFLRGMAQEIEDADADADLSTTTLEELQAYGENGTPTNLRECMGQQGNILDTYEPPASCSWWKRLMMTFMKELLS